MTDYQTPSIPKRMMVLLCCLVLFSPKRFARTAAPFDTLPEHHQINTDHAAKIRRAFWGAGITVAASAVSGWMLSVWFFRTWSYASPRAITSCQVAATLIILWATLAVRGWDIQTIDGTTMTESVNQWLFRFAYFCGTTLLVLSLFWPDKPAMTPLPMPPCSASHPFQ